MNELIFKSGVIRETNKVYETMDYNLFSRLEENRIVTDGRVMKLLASLGEKPLATPIICNEKLEIIDGQGRYEARKKLGLPIPFLIIEGCDFEDCVRLNRFNTNWEIKDWCDSWARNENPDIAKNYINFLECVKSNKISVSRTMRLAGITNTNDVIEKGTLVFTENMAQAVTEIIFKGKEILTALCFTQRTNDAFWISVKVATITNGYDHEKMVRNCAICRSTYQQMSNIESELKEFSRIYNHKKSVNKIYFEDYMRNKGYNVRSYENNSCLTNKQNVSTLKANHDI